MEKLYSLIGSAIREGKFGVQCVGFVRYAVFVLHKIKLLSFGGTAKTGRVNKGRTFRSMIWKKIRNRKDNFPKPGDVIFFDIVRTGHVAIVAKADINSVTVLEQNGLGIQDPIREHTYNYVNPKCLGWYSPL